MSKQITLTLSEPLYKALLKKKKNYRYLTMEEFISDLLREALTRMQRRTSKREKQFEDYFSQPTKKTKQLEREGYL